MNFYVTLQDQSVKKLEDLQIGDMVLCDDDKFHEVKNIFVVSSYPLFCRLSNGWSYYFPERMQIKTIHGFKKPELWDILDIGRDVTPQIINIRNIEKVMMFYDILIDGNIVTPEGTVFKYSS